MANTDALKHQGARTSFSPTLKSHLAYTLLSALVIMLMLSLVRLALLVYNSDMIGDTPYATVAEGFLNLPMSERAAIRLVAWNKHDAGYIDNVYGTRTFPSWDADSGGNGTIDNAGRARKDYNEVDTTGARLALKVDLDDNWSITPTIMGQQQKSEGGFAVDPQVGELALTHFYPETSDDRWWQAALTVEGRIGNFDLTYAFARLDRDVDVEQDYNDYAFWYDTLAAYGAYTCSDFDPDTFTCAPGSLVNPSQYIQGVDGYQKTSHELRIASPTENRLRFVAGVFMQDQEHDIEQRYKIDGLSPVQSVTGWPDTIWLTKQNRVDRDKAVFGQVEYDITDQLMREEVDTAQLIEELKKEPKRKTSVPMRGRTSIGSAGKDALLSTILDLDAQMKLAASELQFELAARIRDEISELKRELRQIESAGHA